MAVSGQFESLPADSLGRANICVHAARLARIAKTVTISVLRHSAAVHWLELGLDVRTLQKILGHGRLSTTMRYMQLTYRQQPHVHPLDLLPPPTEREAS